MEVYPIKWTVHRIYIAATVITNHLIKNALLMSEIQFNVNVANGVAIDVANDILPVRWMEVYPFCVNQSE